MTVTTYDGPGPFLSANEAYLEAHEAENAILICGAKRLLAAAKGAGTLLASVSEAGACLLCLFRSPDHPAVLSYDPGVAPEAVGELAGRIATLAPDLLGVMGDAATSLAFALQWQQLTGTTALLETDETLYRLRSVRSPPSSPGRLRTATRSDLDTVTAWRHAFRREATHTVDEPAARLWAAEAIAHGDVFLWEDAAPRCMAARVRPTRTTISIGSVYTPPAERNRGYATACVAALSQLLLDCGYESCVLYTDNSNPIPSVIYPRIGYVPIGAVKVYHFARQ